jgi:hypothetical protein
MRVFSDNYNFEFRCTVEEITIFHFESFHSDFESSRALNFVFIDNNFAVGAFAYCLDFACVGIMSVSFWNCCFDKSFRHLYNFEKNSSSFFGTESFYHSFSFGTWASADFVSMAEH